MVNRKVATSKDLIMSNYLLNPDRFVYPFVIKEKNGKERTIITYNKSGDNGAALRRIHEDITAEFSKHFAERNSHSFAYHKNVRCFDALQSHLKSNIFIKLDIHHFFESITEELFFSVYGEYFNKEWREKISVLFYKGALSIGFVSSPVISDFFMKKFDKDIANYLLEHPELHYSRYSDDILLSSELDDDKSLNELFEFVKKELALFKLEINEKKTRRITLDYEKHNSISYLGLNLSKSDYLNNKITISKRYILFLLFLIEKQRRYTDHCYPLENEIKSRVAYLAYNSPISYQRFQKKHMNKYGEPYMFTPKELDKRSASHVVNEIPNFEEYSKLFKINIHKKVAGKDKQGFAINDAIEIEEYLGRDQEVVEIPYFVDSIGDKAFKMNYRIKKIVLNEKLKSIGKNAFNNLYCLEEINLPTALRYIGEGAFQYCPSLKKVVIPEKIKNISSSAFNGCKSLKEVILSEGLQTISSSAFSNTAIESITLPDSLKEIHSNAFESCEKLKDINLSTSHIELIGSHAFNNCVLLNEVTLPNTLLTLGNNAFSNCYSLKKVYIPASTLEIGLLPFSNCPLLKSIDVDRNNKIYLHREDNTSIVDHNGYLLFTIKDTIDSDIKAIGVSAFADKFIKSIVVPEGVSSIYPYAFNNCSLLKNVSLPSTLTSLANNAFSNCISLEEISIPESIKSISPSLFAGCTSLKSVKMSEEVTSIGNHAFANCEKLQIKLPNNLQEIGQYAFSGCIGIKDLFIPAKVKQIKRDAFKGINYTLDSIKVDPLNITFSSGEDTNTIYNVKKGILLFGCKGAKITQGIRTINKYAFAYCSSLKSIELPNTVQTIGKAAFIGCNGLTKVDLSMVNKIEESAFEKCINLQEVKFPNSLTVIKDKAFAATKLKKIDLPESLTSFGKNTFANCSFLEEINLPSTFTEKDLHNSVFDNCVSLKHIKVNPQNQSFDTSVDCDALISKNGTLLLGSANTIIPSNVKRISNSAFSRNVMLEHIDIPSSVEVLDYGAFTKCSSLKSVKFFNNLTSIPLSTFADCLNLEVVALPNTVKSIEHNAFINCKKLKTINLPASLEEIGSAAFSGSGLEEIILPAEVKSIGGRAFEKTNIKNIKLPSGVEVVSQSCFANCEKLEAIDLKHIKTVQGFAFSGCINLKSVLFNDDTNFVGNNHFSKCTNLENVHLPDSLKEIPSSCFSGCSSLKKVNFPSKLLSIGSSAFEDCSLLEVSALPESLQIIDKYAFKNNKNIHDLFLSKELISFSNGAFSGCEIEHISIDPANSRFNDLNSDIISYLDKDGLRHLLLGCKHSLIPEGINIIDSSAFINVKKLHSFKLPDTLMKIDACAFYNVDLGVKEIILPKSLESFGQSAFSNIKNIKFNKGLKSIGRCDYKDVKSLYLPASLESITGDFNENIKFEVEQGNKLYSSIDGNILLAGKNIIFTNKDARLPLPNECESIGGQCYSNRTFDVVNIPEGVVELSGFRNCHIKELHLPKSLKSITGFANNSVIEKVVVSKDNPYFYSDEKGINLFDITRRVLYYCKDGNIPEGVTRLFGGVVNHQGIDRLVIPSTYHSDMRFDTRLYKEVVVSKDNPYHYSKDNAIITKRDNAIVYMTDPAIIPEGVERIASSFLNIIGEPYSLISVPKSVKFIDKAIIDIDKKPLAIKVHKDNPIFDSREDCNAIIITAKNLLVVDSKQTVVPKDVIVSKNIEKSNINRESSYAFTDVSISKGTFFDDSADLPF